MKPAIATAARVVFLIAVTIVLAVVISRVNRSDATAPLVAEIGKQGPEFTLPTVAGDTVSLSSKRGKVVVLDFWATWCPPCVEGMPITEKIVERYADRGVELIAINVAQAHEVVASFVEKQGFKGIVALGGDSGVERKYKVQYLPQLVVIDREGVLRSVAAVTPDQLEEWLTPAIESALKSGEASGK